MLSQPFNLIQTILPSTWPKREVKTVNSKVLQAPRENAEFKALRETVGYKAPKVPRETAVFKDQEVNAVLKAQKVKR